MEFLADRAERRAAETGLSLRERFLEILDKASDAEPPPEDRLPEHLQPDE